ncbi:hypothetical protein DAI22_09g007401 [Oryza sativa Japonica Group]|nr:hypothetical protein DAI22_09g007401 [Oryza sativa Japonica Group]
MTATSPCHLPSARLHRRPRNLHGLHIDLDQDPLPVALCRHHRLPSAERPLDRYSLPSVSILSVSPSFSLING